MDVVRDHPRFMTRRLGGEPATRDLLEALRLRFPDLHAHGTDVAVLSVRIGRLMGLSSGRIERLGRAALLHDVGKQEVPAAILAKPGALDPHERALIERHCDTGHRLLHQAGLPEEATIVLHHHERIDGHGYPCGLRGTEIPLESRIIAVADSFDAMTSDRPYRDTLSDGAAIAELMRVRGSQCDANVVANLRAVVERAVA
jgi:HD-GYP domain-containing protein (c-di-GMP phosphodiesterase class II)